MLIAASYLDRKCAKHFEKLYPVRYSGIVKEATKNILANGERKINEPCEGAAPAGGVPRKMSTEGNDGNEVFFLGLE